MNESIFHKELIKVSISIPFNIMGKNLKQYFENYAVNNIEGMCRNEGYVKSNSSKIINYSAGLIESNDIIYDLTYEVDICTPYDNMICNFIIKNINKIGIRAIYSNNDNPIMAFISREHNSDKDFELYEEEQIISVKVLGNRYELNDEYITIIGEII
jgi:hypothetical protein